MKEKVESKSTPKLDAVGERDITMLSIRKRVKYTSLYVSDREGFNSVVLEVLKRRFLDISQSLISLVQFESCLLRSSGELVRRNIYSCM